MNGLKWDPRISLGNLIVIAGITLTLILWYSNVASHISNPALHPMQLSNEQKNIAFDERFNLKMAVYEERLKQIDLKLDRLIEMYERGTK